VFPGWFVEDYIDDKIWVLNPKIIECKINREPEIISESDYRQIAWLLSKVAR
jgi:hypothetical protein